MSDYPEARRRLNPTTRDGDLARGLYQSYMNAVTQDDPVEVVVIGEVQERNERYSGPDYMVPVASPARDDDATFLFMIENEDMAQAMMNGDEELGVEPIAKQIPNRILLSTRGSGEDAEAVWRSIPNENLPDGTPTDASSSGGGSRPSGPRYGPENILDAYLEAREVAMEEIPGITDDDGQLTERGQREVATLFIQFFRTGRRAPLYEGQPLASQYNSSEDGQEDVDEMIEDEVMGGEDELPF